MGDGQVALESGQWHWTAFCTEKSELRSLCLGGVQVTLSVLGQTQHQLRWYEPLFCLDNLHRSSQMNYTNIQYISWEIIKTIVKKNYLPGLLNKHLLRTRNNEYVKCFLRNILLLVIQWTESARVTCPTIPTPSGTRQWLDVMEMWLRRKIWCPLAPMVFILGTKGEMSLHLAC